MFGKYLLNKPLVADYTPTRSFWSAADSTTCQPETTTPGEEG